MGQTLEEAKIEVLDTSTGTYAQDKAWQVAVSFPEIIAGMSNKEDVTSPVEYAIYRVESWTDELVDLNEVQLVVFSLTAKEYRLIKGDDESVSERVKTEMLNQSRDIMSKVEESLSAE